MSKPQEIIDARNGDYIVTNGKKLRSLIKSRIIMLQEANKRLMERMNNELPNKESAVDLMIALSIPDNSVNEQTLFFRACVDRAVFLDMEIRNLTTIAQSFYDTETTLYRISLEDAKRFGL